MRCQMAARDCGPTADRRYLQVAIEDTGIGIPDDQMANLFKPFSQLKTTSAGENNSRRHQQQQYQRLAGGWVTASAGLQRKSQHWLQPQQPAQPQPEAEASAAMLPADPTPRAAPAAVTPAADASSSVDAGGLDA